MEDMIEITTIGHVIQHEQLTIIAKLSLIHALKYQKGSLRDKTQTAIIT